MFGIFLSVLSMLLYLAETGVQLHLAITSFESDFVAAIVYLAYVVVSLVIFNVTSAVLVLRNMDFSGKTCGRFLCVLLHSFQLGLIWRCLKLLMLYDESDWREFLALRLIHTGLQTLPFIVTNAFLTVQKFSFPAEDLANLFLMLLSSAIALSTFNLGKDLFDSEEFTEFKSRFKKPCGICLLILGSFFLLLSRCGSMALMLAILNYWVAIPIGIHFTVFWIISSIYRCCNKSCTVWKFLRDFIFSYLNIFDIVEPDLAKVHCRNVFYYSAILLENIVMTALWMYLADGDYLFKLTSVVMVLVSYILGVIVKSSSCSCIHLDTDEPISIETLDLAAYLTKQPVDSPNSPKLGSRKGSTDSKTRRSRNRSENNSSQPGADVNAIDLHVYDNEAFQNNPITPTTPNVRGKGHRHKRSKKVMDSSDGVKNVIVKSQANESNGDLASSNSRNTNTLNISSQSNQHSGELKSDIEALQEFNQHVISGFSNSQRSKRRKPDLRVINAETKPASSINSKKNISTGKIGPSPGLSKKSGTKKTAIPLFPSECNDIIGSKEFGSPKAKHVLSNSVKDYGLNGTFDTETSYSEYVSCSYYDTSTDWCSTSYDSDFAVTWPQSKTVSIVNLHSLPKHKFSNSESVHLWLSKLEAWEPLHDYSDLPNISTNSETNDHVSNSIETADKGDHSHIHSHHHHYQYQHHYKYHDQRVGFPADDREFQCNSFQRSIDNTESGRNSKLSSHNETFLKSFSISSDQSGYNVSLNVKDYIDTGEMAEDKTVVLWQSEKSTSQDIVQESMV